MPHKMWVHNCKEQRGIRIVRAVEVCPVCGQRGEYDGWNYSVVEHMGVYERRYGLKPLGRHRALADQLIDSRMKACPQCNGHGMIDAEDAENYRICPQCKGNRYLFDGTEEEFEALRQRVLQEFPDALPGTKDTQSESKTSGFTGGIFIKPKDNSPEAIDATAKSIMEALGIGKKKKKSIHASISTSTGSTLSNMKITLAACNPHARRVFETLVNGWNKAGGKVLCIKPGRIYLKLNTKTHARGNSAQFPHNFNLVVLASPRGKRSAHIQVTWDLGRADKPFGYLDCIPKVVAQFEKMTASLPGFEQKGSITRLMLNKQFKPLHSKLLLDGMKEVKDAEAKAK